MTITDPDTLDGQTVAARALGWDGSDTDDTDWALFRDDLPLLTSVIGTLTVEWVDELEYLQFVVNGIPVDPASIEVVTLAGDVIVTMACQDCGESTAFFRAEVPRDPEGKWCKGAGCNTGGGMHGATINPAEFAKVSPRARTSAPSEWFASAADRAEAKKIADAKARNVPKPTAADIAKNREQARRAKEQGARPGGELRGNSKTRRERGEALFAEFGGTKKGYVPCTHCGIKTAPKGRGGFASMEQDKLLTLHEGGKYGTARNFPNLIPACGGCNKSRGDTPYPVRPAWAATSVVGYQFAAMKAGERLEAVGSVVVGFPEGWDDPLSDTLDAPVRGELGHRTVKAFFGDYEQWIVGGEVVDPAHIYAEDDALVASAGEQIDVCPNCAGLVAAAGEVPRDPSGKWCPGAQCTGAPATAPTGSAKLHTFHSDALALEAWEAEYSGPNDPLFHDPELELVQLRAEGKFNRDAPPKIQASKAYYETSGYEPINQYLKHDTVGSDFDTKEQLDKDIANIDTAIGDFGIAAPADIVRGKGRGPMADMNFKPGDEFTEKAYGSWSHDTAVGKRFGYEYTSQTSNKHLVTRMKNPPASLRAVVGNGAESEYIVQRGTSYRVTSVHDFVGPTRTFRYMEVEPIP